MKVRRQGLGFREQCWEVLKSLPLDLASGSAKCKTAAEGHSLRQLRSMAGSVIKVGCCSRMAGLQHTTYVHQGDHPSTRITRGHEDNSTYSDLQQLTKQLAANTDSKQQRPSPPERHHRSGGHRHQPHRSSETRRGLRGGSSAGSLVWRSRALPVFKVLCLRCTAALNRCLQAKKRKEQRIIRLLFAELAGMSCTRCTAAMPSCDRASPLSRAGKRTLLHEVLEGGAGFGIRTTGIAMLSGIPGTGGQGSRPKTKRTDAAGPHCLPRMPEGLPDTSCMGLFVLLSLVLLLVLLALLLLLLLLLLLCISIASLGV